MIRTLQQPVLLERHCMRLQCVPTRYNDLGSTIARVRSFDRVLYIDGLRRHTEAMTSPSLCLGAMTTTTNAAKESEKIQKKRACVFAKVTSVSLRIANAYLSPESWSCSASASPTFSTATLGLGAPVPCRGFSAARSRIPVRAKRPKSG